MNFKKQFDALIQLIEDNVKKDSSQIMKLVRSEFSFWSPNVISHAFEYITGMRLKEYIMKRRLISTLKYQKSGGTTLEKATDRFGYSSVENYRRDFRNCFGKPISKVREEDYQYVAEALTLDKILQTEEGNVTLEPMIFDSESEFDQIKTLFILTDFYDFNYQQAEVAIHLSKTLDFSVEDIFDFCFDYFDHDYEVSKRYRDVNVKNLAVLCLKLKKCVREGLELMLDIDESCMIPDYRNIDDVVWKVILDDSYGFDYEKYPSLVISVVEKMKKANIPIDKVEDVFERLEWIEDVDEAIDWNWDNGLDVTEESILREMNKNQSEIESTYTNDFLGLSSNDSCEEDDMSQWFDEE